MTIVFKYISLKFSSLSNLLLQHLVGQELRRGTACILTVLHDIWSSSGGFNDCGLEWSEGLFIHMSEARREWGEAQEYWLEHLLWPLYVAGLSQSKVASG